jgi:8-oxo-dGTP pyrophosphatase MutT (NUDIX family)
MKNGAVFSYGVICFRMAYDAFSNTIKPFFIMVQRKDSICFVEFVRGKYNIFDADYVRVLISNMTVDEAAAVCTRPFDELWRKVWVSGNRRVDAEYRQARCKFETMRAGFQRGDAWVTLASLAAEANPQSREQDWEFPKGRRGSGESGFVCAMREFEEEAGVPRRFLRPARETPVLFTKEGCNDVLYKFVYFVMQCTPEVRVGRINDVQAREVMSVRWLDFKSVVRKLRTPQHVRAFMDVNARIMQAASMHLQPPH